MREIRLSGLEGGVAGNGHPYPYRSRDGRSTPRYIGRTRLSKRPRD